MTNRPVETDAVLEYERLREGHEAAMQEYVRIVSPSTFDALIKTRAALDAFVKGLAVKGTQDSEALRHAFVRGAKWWEYKSSRGTMWQSDQRLSWEEAERRYPDTEPPADVPGRWALRSRDTGHLVTMSGTSFWTREQAEMHATKYRDLEPVRVQIVPAAPVPATELETSDEQ